jgi:hypothetical protein
MNHYGKFFTALASAVATAALLSACGGGDAGAPFSSTASIGYAVDGYLKDASVKCDASGVVVLTDSSGFFRFPDGCSSGVTLTGGTNVDTLLPFTGTLKAPAGSKMVTPLTTLLVGGMTQSQVNASLGLPADTDLSNTDPAYTLVGILVHPELMKKTLAVQQLLMQTTESLAGVAGDATATTKQGIFSEVASAFAATLSSGGKLNSDSTTVDVTVLNGLVKAAALRVAASSQVPALTKNAVAAINADTFAVVTSGGMKAQAEALLVSTDLISANLATLTKKLQGDSTIKDALVGAAFLSRAPTDSSVSAARDAITSAVAASLSSSAGATIPTSAPSTTIPVGAVTIYSETASAAGFNPFPNWGQATQFSEATLASNKSLKYTALNYEGIEFTSVDVSGKGSVHFDMWSPDLTSVKVSIISAGKENAVTKTLTTGSWNSIDIDLALYTVPVKTAIIQIKLESTTPGTLYVDNIYFYGSAGGGSVACGTTEPTCAPTTAVPAGATVIYSETASAAGFNPFPNWGQATQFSEATLASNKSLKYTALNYEGIEFTSVDVSGKGSVHFDMWSPDLTSVKVSIISAGKENAVTKTLTTGSWNSIDIDLALYTVPVKTAIIQIKLESTTPGTLYVDNIYFYGSAGGGSVACGTTEPTCAPTTAVPAGATVIYSETASAAGFNPFPNWGQATQFSEATLASNKSLKYTALNYEGIEFTSVDVSGKGSVHFDMWSPDLTSVKVSIISAGKENAVTKTLTTGSWNSIDIDLALYTVPVKTAIIQIKLESTTPGTLYVDNIYFWGTGTGGTGTGSTPNPTAAAGSGGAVTIPLLTAAYLGDFGAAGNAVFAGDYIGGIDTNGNHATWGTATTNGVANNGNIGYFQDNTLSTSIQKLEENGWVAGLTDNPAGVPSFFRYFILTAPASTFTNSYMGLFANAPNNGTVDVSSYGSIKFRLWGPAEMYQDTSFSPTLEMKLTGPKVEGCTATGSGATEIKKTFVADQKIGAASTYRLSLAGWTVVGTCGTDTTVASVLTKLAQVVVTVPGTNFNFTHPNVGGTVTTYTTGLNLGPIIFTAN